MSFKDKYKVSDAGCWIWQAAKDKDGYGKVRYQGKDYRAHRLSYQMHTGVNPKEMLVLHKCDTPSCVNPSCLFLGTNQDNMSDKVAKGRHPKHEDHYRSKLTHRDVELIREMTKRHKPSAVKTDMGFGVLKFLSSWFGVSNKTLCNIHKGRKWKHLGG